MTAGRMPIRLTTLRPMRDGAIVACVVLAIAHSYWASGPLNPYRAVRPGQQDAYFYAPVFTQLLGPLHLLPWPAFIGLWTLFLSAALVWQAGLWTGIVLLFVPVFADLSVPVSAMLALQILWINGMAMLVGVVALVAVVPALLGPAPAMRWLSGAGSAGPPPSAARSSLLR